MFEPVYSLSYRRLKFDDRHPRESIVGSELPKHEIRADPGNLKAETLRRGLSDFAGNTAIDDLNV
jgi:hypothetical protein